jgi:hypothetical protein
MQGPIGVNVTLGLTHYNNGKLDKVKECAPLLVGRVKQACRLPRIQWGDPCASAREGRGRVLPPAFH